MFIMTDSSIQWNESWKNLCKDLERGYSDLDLVFILAVIKRQQSLFALKPDNVSCSYFIQLESSLPLIKVDYSSISLLCYATIPTRKGKLSMRNHISEAALAGSIKFLKLLLPSYYWCPNDSLDPL